MYTLRVLAGLSTSDLARLTGTTRQTINSLENGKTEKMNGTLLMATKAVLSEIADNNESNSFCLALLKLALNLLFDRKYPSGGSLLKYEFMCATDAFLAVAKLSEAGFSEDKLEKLSEIILKAELDNNYAPSAIDEITGDYELSSMYEIIGFPAFFSERKKAKEQLRKMLFQTYKEDFEKEKGDE